MPTGLTLFDEIWNRHVVTLGPGGRTLLYIATCRSRRGRALGHLGVRRGGWGNDAQGGRAAPHVRWTRGIRHLRAGMGRPLGTTRLLPGCHG